MPKTRKTLLATLSIVLLGAAAWTVLSGGVDALPPSSGAAAAASPRAGASTAAAVEAPAREAVAVDAAVDHAVDAEQQREQWLADARTIQADLLAAFQAGEPAAIERARARAEALARQQPR